jgi:hypothetical protein
VCASALVVGPEKRKAVIREEADFAGDCTQVINSYWGQNSSRADFPGLAHDAVCRAFN